MGIQQAAAQLQKEHIRLADELSKLQKQLKENELLLRDLSSKFTEANKVIDRLEEENNELKSQVEDIHDKSISHVNESKNQQR